MRAAATERGGNLLRTVKQATEENWEACPHCQGEEEKQQRDEARRILSPEAPQQTWKAKPLASPRLGEMQEGTEQRRGKVEKEAGFGQREKTTRAGNDCRDQGLFGNPDDWQARQVMETPNWLEVGNHLKAFKCTIHRNCWTPTQNTTPHQLVSFHGSAL